MTTQRKAAALIVVALAPGLIAAVGHALQLNDCVVMVLAAVAWGVCVAAWVRLAISWWSR